MLNNRRNDSEIGRKRVVDSRRAICNKCEFRHPTQKTCTKCGCPVDEMTADLKRTCALPEGKRKW